MSEKRAGAKEDRAVRKEGRKQASSAKGSEQTEQNIEADECCCAGQCMWANIGHVIDAMRWSRWVVADRMDGWIG